MASMVLKITIMFSFLSLLFPLYSARPAESPGVVINEIAWMGSRVSGNHEWIELYNNSTSAVELAKWKLTTQDGSPQINLKNKIPAKGFFLLERTSDKTIPKIKADLIYKGSLANKGEHLKLIDDKKNIIDEVDCSDGWFAGNNETKQTMERKNSVSSGNLVRNWITSKNPGGTPKAQNSNGRNQIKSMPPKSKPTPSQPNNQASITSKFGPANQARKGLAKAAQPLFREYQSVHGKSKIKTQKTLTSNPKIVFFISLAIALFSGIIILLLKKTLNRYPD